MLDVGGESAFGGRPPVPAEEEAARVVPVIERIAARARRARLGRHLQAGGRRGRDRRGRAARQRRLRAARPGAGRRLRGDGRRPGAHAHARPRRRARCSTPDFYDRRRRRRARLPRRADRGGASTRGVRAGAAAARPGPGLRQDAGADGRGAAPARRAARARAARCCCAVSRKDFLGAITGRAAARARRGDAGRRRLGRRTPARTILRVHDVRAAADFLAVRAVLHGERDAGAAPRASRRIATPRATTARLSTHGCRSLRTTRPECQPTTTEGGPACLQYSTATRSSRARSPTCT